MDDRVKIPIVKNGKDICRLIFTPKTEEGEGVYDIKFDFKGQNPKSKVFKVQTYRLFSHRPVVWDINESNSDISYHCTKGDKPTKVHIKNKEIDEYTTLPLKKLKPPNVNQMFPLPIFKIEIPQNVVEQSKLYKRKKIHNPIELENSNVIEFYMLPKGKFSQNYMEKYEEVFKLYFMLSFEFFSSNTPLSDYQKGDSIFLYKNSEIKGMVKSDLEGMDLYVNSFYDPRVNNKEKIIITFIENELCEAVLLNALHHEKKDSEFYGGSNLYRLKSQLLLDENTPVEDSIAGRLLKMNTICEEDKLLIKQNAIQEMKQLKNELENHELTINNEEKLLKNSASLFMNSLYDLQNSCRDKHIHNLENPNYQISDEDLWFMGGEFNSEDIHILFAKYMDKSRYTLIKRSIRSKDYVEPSNTHKNKYKFDGYEITLFDFLSVHETIFNHIWLEYDDRFDVDLLRGNLNLFLNEGEKEPPYSITRALITSNNDYWSGMKEKLLKNGFICGNVKRCNTTPKLINNIMKRNNCLLERVYNKIIDNIKCMK